MQETMKYLWHIMQVGLNSVKPAYLSGSDADQRHGNISTQNLW